MAKTRRAGGVGRLMEESIVTAISEGRLAEHQKLDPIRSLSAQYGISASTVVNTLRRLQEEGWLIGRPRSGYFVAPGASRLKSQRRRVALVVSTIVEESEDDEPLRQPYFYPLFHELLKAAPLHGFEISVCQFDGDSNAALARLKDFPIVIVLSGARAELLEWLTSDDVIAVLLGTWHPVYTPFKKIELIWYDFLQNMADACAYLSRLGHRRIVYAARSIQHGRRADAFQWCQSHFGYTGQIVNEEYPDDRSKDNHVEVGRDLARRILEMDPWPTGVISSNNKVAWSILNTFRERGVSVPRDMSVIGLNDLEIAELAVPPLTTVRPPYPEIARECFLSIQRRLKTPLEYSRLLFLKDGQVVERESCGPPPGR